MPSQREYSSSDYLVGVGERYQVKFAQHGFVRLAEADERFAGVPLFWRDACEPNWASLHGRSERGHADLRLERRVYRGTRCSEATQRRSPAEAATSTIAPLPDQRGAASIKAGVRS